MKRQVNLVIDADVARLDMPLPPMRARAGCEFVARVVGVPGDCSDVVVRVSDGEAFWDFPASCDSNGDWTCRILGAAFPAGGGDGWYEVRAASADGEPTAIGRGRCTVSAWSAGTAAALDARRRHVATILDERGGQHAIWAVLDDVGEWTYRIGAVDEAETVPLGTLPAGGDSAVYISASE